jgi:hypothetical protein
VLSRIDRHAPAVFTGFAMVFVLLVLFKVYASFDSIPYWDMYSSYLGFYARFTAGDWFALWEPHNEHRIVLTKLLFLMDLSALDGTTRFLWYVNVVLAGLIALLLVLFLREVPEHLAFAWTPAFLVALSFSELQKENLYWSFQSQFFLAYLLPLAALYLALLSVTRPDRSTTWFAASTGLGILSVGTMANGVLALPVLTVFALLMRMSWQRVGLLAGLSVICILVYVQGSPDNPDTPPLSQVLREEPLTLVHYVLTYLGSPFRKLGRDVASLAGLFLLILALRAAWRHIPRGRASAAEIALLGFMGYILLTAIVTAIGRVSFGVGQAGSSRYATPNLMNWCALFMLYLPWLSATPERAVKTTRALLVLMLLLFVVQLSALRPDKRATDRMGAALALELGIPDQDQVIHVYPRANEALESIDQLRDDPKAIFAMDPIKDAGDQIGTTTVAAIFACDDPAFRVTAVPDTRWSRLTGPAQPGQGQRLLLSDAGGQVLGVAIQGRAGIIGYLPQGPTPPLYIGTEAGRCGPLTVTPAP